MNRVLVPLDGSDFAASILPDAKRLAGDSGELILVRDATTSSHDDLDTNPEAQSIRASEDYLHTTAVALRTMGATVRTETFVLGDPATAIDEAAARFEVDAIACATHGRSGWQSVVHPSIAWKVLAHSPVPVLLRRFQAVGVQSPAVSLTSSTILVPLDGSHRGEESLPLAVKLAQEWNGSLLLVHVVPDVIPPVHRKRLYQEHSVFAEEYRAGESYLAHIAHTIQGTVVTAVLSGPIVETLVATVTQRDVACVVMASHGRTGMAKAIVGSVASGLVHGAGVPLLVIPGTATRELGPRPSVDHPLMATVG